jgi:hypothetical protein
MSWYSWLLAALAPFLVALGAAGLLRRYKRPKSRRKSAPWRGQRLAEAAPVLGFLVGFIGVVQGVPYLNGTAHHRVGEAAVLVLAAVLILALLAPGLRVTRYAALGLSFLAIFWQLPSGRLPAEDWLVAAAFGLATAVALDRLVLLARIGAAPLLLLAVASLGLAAIAVFAHAGLLGGMALALGTACAGWLAWQRPFEKSMPAPAAAIGGGLVFAGLAFATWQGAARTPWALVLLPTCFWAEPILRRLPVLAPRNRKKPAPSLAVAAAAALPAAAAAVVALLL